MTQSETPLACTLSAAALIQRGTELRALAARSLRRAKRDGLSLILTFDAGARGDVERMVAQEKLCCAFLEFSLKDSVPGEVELRITAPRDAVGFADSIFSAFATAANSAVGCCPGV